MSAITNYTDIVSLERTKTYLRLDDNGTELDDELTMFINAGARLLEEYTNWILKPKTKTYDLQQGNINIYDAPIVVVDSDENEYDITRKTLYTRFCSTTQETLELTVGYTDTDQVEPTFVLAILEMVRVWFYNAESDSEPGIIEPHIKKMLDPFKRFIF